ncbi:MAG: DUF1972 domain-containing protein [Lachnospiraceae bacterium]|nr:DUF1972 domain-containing protein [Lachnospiraceae bacterium]
MSEPIHVFIIGLRGYTQNYGGWESFVHNLIRSWRDEGIRFFAFEKVENKEEEGESVTDGVTCIRVYEKERGSSAMMKYDRHCTQIACERIRAERLSKPVLFHLGVRIGPYLWWKRRFFRREGIRLMDNPAGAEWRRTKWNRLVQLYLFISALMTAKTADCLVCDNEGIRELYQRIVPGRKPVLSYVPYGVTVPERIGDNPPEKARAFLARHGLERDGYYLILGRFVPENNYVMMLKGFMASQTKRRLLIITNYETEKKRFLQRVREETGYEQDPRVIMAGAVYEEEILHTVRQYAYAYIHGHSVGGTNPGLLEAMAETDVSLLYRVTFNRRVGGGCAAYFGSGEELAEKIGRTERMTKEQREKRGKEARERMRRCYDRQDVADGYARVIRALWEGEE